MDNTDDADSRGQELEVAPLHADGDSLSRMLSGGWGEV